MDEQSISDIAEVIPEVMNANNHGFRWGFIVSSLLWAVLLASIGTLLYIQGAIDLGKYLCG